jgi:hypothetical protein
MKALTKNECKEINGGYDLIEEAKHFDLWKFVKEVLLNWED